MNKVALLLVTIIMITTMPTNSKEETLATDNYVITLSTGDIIQACQYNKSQKYNI